MSDAQQPTKTWGDIFYAAVRRGDDEGYAATLADRAMVARFGKGWDKRRQHLTDPKTATFAAIEAAGGHVEIDPEGYSLELRGAYIGTVTTLAALAEMFAEVESDRIADQIKRDDDDERADLLTIRAQQVDACLNLCDRMRAENARLRAALEIALFYADRPYLKREAPQHIEIETARAALEDTRHAAE